MSVVLRLDYATVNFAAGTVDADLIGQKLAGDPALLCWQKKGLSEGSPVCSPLGLRYQHNSGYTERPHKLDVSGVGCAKFLLTLPALRSDDMHFSRLDFAFDVVMSRREWRSFLADCFCSSMDSDRQRKRYKLTGDGEAMTVYIGSRTSAKFFRIYNKTLQDRKYQLMDGDGQPVALDDESCVIRYEIELHRHKQVGKHEWVYDPSPAFDWYYSGAADDHARLHDEIKRLWLSFGNDVLLPDGFADLEFVDLTDVSQNRNFVQSSEQEKLEKVQAALHDYPHSFDRTLRYVTEKFGKYIPYILADDEYRKFCFQMCELRFGFVPEYYFEQSEPAGYRDLDDLDELDPDIPESWYEADEEDQLLINKDFERRHNQWS